MKKQEIRKIYTQKAAELLAAGFAAAALFRLERVFCPATPSADSLLAFWYALTADAVLLP